MKWRYQEYSWGKVWFSCSFFLHEKLIELESAGHDPGKVIKATFRCPLPWSVLLQGRGGILSHDWSRSRPLHMIEGTNYLAHAQICGKGVQTPKARPSAAVLFKWDSSWGFRLSHHQSTIGQKIQAFRDAEDKVGSRWANLREKGQAGWDAWAIGSMWPLQAITTNTKHFKSSSISKCRKAISDSSHHKPVRGDKRFWFLSLALINEK